APAARGGRLPRLASRFAHRPAHRVEAQGEALRDRHDGAAATVESRGMPQNPPRDPAPHRSVLDILGSRTGLAPKVLLPDSDSEHGASPVVDPASTASKLVPQGRGNYQLLGEIARGGMGVILKGHDSDLGRDVAVKVLDGELARRPEVVQRFVEEAQIGGQLQHPGIVPVYELGLMADERPYFTMKLVKGRTLAAHFKQRKSVADQRKL